MSSRYSESVEINESHITDMSSNLRLTIEKYPGPGTPSQMLAQATRRVHGLRILEIPLNIVGSCEISRIFPTKKQSWTRAAYQRGGGLPGSRGNPIKCHITQ
jgi:hypothetical protein